MKKIIAKIKQKQNRNEKKKWEIYQTTTSGVVTKLNRDG